MKDLISLIQWWLDDAEEDGGDALSLQELDDLILFKVHGSVARSLSGSGLGLPGPWGWVLLIDGRRYWIATLAGPGP
jgi:hypothetical protein